MSTSHESSPQPPDVPSALDRAEALMDRLEERLKQLRSLPASSKSTGNQHANGQSATGSTPTAVDRAEQTLDQLGQQIGALGVVVGFRLRRFAARMREEAEDLWAEAQAVRHPPDTPSS